MKDAIAQARTQVAEMIAQEKLFQGDMEKNQAQAQEWARKAELALGRGSEELAKEALRRKVDYDRNASSYMQQLIAQQRSRYQTEERPQRIAVEIRQCNAQPRIDDRASQGCDGATEDRRNGAATLRDRPIVRDRPDGRQDPA